MLPTDYSVYSDRNKSSIIVCFDSFALKRHTMDAMRKKQSLFAEEIYQSVTSNSRVYANDHLTPYFANIFQCAWRAKKDGLIASASSLGGKIRVRKSEYSPSHTINTESQLNDLIASTEQMETQTEINEVTSLTENKFIV